MSIGSASRSTSTIRRMMRSAFCNSLRRAPAARIQIGNGLSDAPIGSVRNIYLVVTDLEAARSRLLERGVQVGEIRHKAPLERGTEVSSSGSTRSAVTMPASPAFSILMVTAGFYRNAGTARSDSLEAR